MSTWVSNKVSLTLYMGFVQRSGQSPIYFRTTSINDLCFKAKTQFEKSIKCIQNGESKEEALKYATDGQIFFHFQERKFSKDRDTTPIEDTPDISNLTTVNYNNDIIAVDDLTFIEEFRKISTGRMCWERCFKEGKNKEFFLDYAHWKSSKSAYHSNT